MPPIPTPPGMGAGGSLEGISVTMLSVVKSIAAMLAAFCNTIYMSKKTNCY
jgi:hypothetical protein